MLKASRERRGNALGHFCRQSGIGGAAGKAIWDWGGSWRGTLGSGGQRSGATMFGSIRTSDSIVLDTYVKLTIVVVVVLVVVVVVVVVVCSHFRE